MWWNLSLAIIQDWDQFEIITTDCRSAFSDLPFPLSLQSTSLLLPSLNVLIPPLFCYTSHLSPHKLYFFRLHRFSFPECLMVDLARNPVRRREGWRLVWGVGRRVRGGGAAKAAKSL